VGQRGGGEGCSGISLPTVRKLVVEGGVAIQTVALLTVALRINHGKSKTVLNDTILIQCNP